MRDVQATFLHESVEIEKDINGFVKEVCLEQIADALEMDYMLAEKFLVLHLVGEKVVKVRLVENFAGGDAPGGNQEALGGER